MQLKLRDITIYFLLCMFDRESVSARRGASVEACLRFPFYHIKGVSANGDNHTNHFSTGGEIKKKEFSDLCFFFARLLAWLAGCNVAPERLGSLVEIAVASGISPANE